MSDPNTPRLGRIEEDLNIPRPLHPEPEPDVPDPDDEQDEVVRPVGHSAL